jgi:hypothetical protein
MVRRAPKRETVGMNFDRSASIAGLPIINGGMEGTMHGTPSQTGTMMIGGPTNTSFHGIELLFSYTTYLHARALLNKQAGSECAVLGGLRARVDIPQIAC